MAENDVVVFVEALTGSAKRIARLSFSTKIVDYIASGKSIFTIGPADSAPVEYLRNHDISLVANNQDEIYDNLNRMSISLIQDYSERAIEFCRSNHDKESIQKNIYRILSDISA